MPSPDVSYTTLRNAIHTAPVGNKFQGYEIISRSTVPTNPNIQVIVVTKAANTWTIYYRVNPDTNGVGKIFKAVDQNGIPWFRSLDTWIGG
jgi:hypothetical protein